MKNRTWRQQDGNLVGVGRGLQSFQRWWGINLARCIGDEKEQAEK